MLGLERRAKLDAGLKERAGLTDRVERAVQLGWPGAVAVFRCPRCTSGATSPRDRTRSGSGVSLAPPALIEPLRKFLAEHPFDTNVFGMTRFPNAQAGTPDPVGQALDIARVVCREHGLEFHLASDRAMHDDLWTNVTAHMWASRYGIGLFEDRVDRGLNHNLTIEIGGMLMTGRRCALLKDGTLDKMPTDLVGLIYKAIDLSDTATVADALHGWIRDDLGLSRCSSCPAASSSLHAPTA